MLISLTDEERQRFKAYCEQEARSEGAMAKQLATMMGDDDPGTKLLRQRVVALILVAKYLDVETQTL